jgi:hypothetical protein
MLHCFAFLSITLLIILGYVTLSTVVQLINTGTQIGADYHVIIIYY